MNTRFYWKALPLVILASMFAFSGCVSSTNVVPPNTPNILLRTAQVRKSRASTWSFPAGFYTPSFQTKNGIYYKAPASVIQHALGMTMNKPGGVFIPFRQATDKRQAAWYDETGNSDVISAMTIQPTNRYPFDPPLQFDYVSAASRYESVPAVKAPENMTQPAAEPSPQ